MENWTYDDYCVRLLSGTSCYVRIDYTLVSDGSGEHVDPDSVVLSRYNMTGDVLSYYYNLHVTQNSSGFTLTFMAATDYHNTPAQYSIYISY